MASNETSVYLGIWTNWSHGAVAGLTYTTTLDKGGLFIAFLALFVTFSGTCFWSIVSFAVHQTLSRQSPQDAIYHQRQAILRNADTSGTALWRFLTLTWAWRKISLAASLKSSSIPMLASLATFFAFAAAGIFSSQVATSRGSQVLVIGNKCSALNGSLITEENVALSQYYGASRIRSSFNYESNCYSRNGTEGCRTYVKNALPMKVTTDGSCPFPGKDAICHPKSGSITLDSGFINSNDDLGINAPPSSQFLYRTVNKCAPILSEGYFRNITTTPQKSIQYFYGTHMRHCGDGPEGCTFEVLYGEGFGSRVARNQYTVTAVTKWQVSPEQSYVVNIWEPIPELAVPDADISVLFLESNDIRYITPVSDPWFKAQNGPQKVTYTSGNLTIYRGDQSARAVACAQQYQFCNPALPKNESCTPLMGIFEATRLASENLFTQPNNKEAFQWTTLGIQNMANGFTEIITTLRGGALLASDTLAGIGQYGLPDNQWAIELQHWFRTTLADLQRTIVDQATGPTDPKVVPVWSPPRSAEARTVCNNQKIRSDSYTSFNVLGLTIIFSIGGLIMLISAFLPDVTAKVQRNRKPFSSLEWASNDTLQLQRLAHEAVGSGEWEGACDDYPLTRKNDLLAELDITNKKHPILRAQTIVEKITERDLKNKATDGERYFLGRIESGMGESVQESLLSVKIPRTSLDFPHRLPV